MSKSSSFMWMSLIDFSRFWYSRSLLFFRARDLSFLALVKSKNFIFYPIDSYRRLPERPSVLVDRSMFLLGEGLRGLNSSRDWFLAYSWFRIVIFRRDRRYFLGMSLVLSWSSTTLSCPLLMTHPPPLIPLNVVLLKARELGVSCCPPATPPADCPISFTNLRFCSKSC